MRRRVDEPIQVKSIHSFVVSGERISPRRKDVGLGFGIALEHSLRDRRPFLGSVLSHASDDGRGQRRSNRFLIFLRRVILRGSKLGQELFRSFADIGHCADTSNRHREAVWENSVVENNCRASGAKALDGFHKSGACFRLQWKARCFHISGDLRRSFRCRNSLKRCACAFHDECGNSKAFSFECIRFQIIGVRAGICFRRGTNCASVKWVFSRDDAKHNRRVGYVTRDWAGIVQQPIQGRDAGDADQTSRREHSHHGARRRWHANRVPGISPITQHCII